MCPNTQEGVSFEKCEEEGVEERKNALRVSPLLHQARHLLQPFVRLPRQLSRGTDDDPDRSFALHEWHPLLLLERKHEQRQREGERLAGTGERDADHVASREAVRGPI